MKDFRQELYENGYFRQEELCFADCDRYQRPRSPVAKLMMQLCVAGLAEGHQIVIPMRPAL